MIKDYVPGRYTTVRYESTGDEFHPVFHHPYHGYRSLESPPEPEKPKPMKKKKENDTYDPYSKIHRILLTQEDFDDMDDEALYNLYEGFTMEVLDWKFNGKYWRVKVRAYITNTQKDVVEAFRFCGILP